MKLPDHKGWFWVLLDGYDKYMPCWFNGRQGGEACFIPGGIGDESSNGVYLEDIEAIGDEIEYPYGK